MTHGALDADALLWFVGWLIAVAVLLAVGWRLPLQTRWARTANMLYQLAVLAAAFALQCWPMWPSFCTMCTST